MTVRRQFLSVTLLLVTFLLSVLASASHASGPVILPSDPFNMPITEAVSVFEDPNSELSVTDVVRNDVPLRFSPSHTRFLKRGLTDATLWLRFSLRNPDNQPRQVVLTLSNAHIDEVSLYDITDLERPQLQTQYDLLGTFPQAHPFQLHIPGKEIRSYLIRIRTDALLTTSIEVKSLSHFVDTEQRVNVVTGIAVGWIIGALLYFLWSAQRRSNLLARAGILYAISVLIFIPAWVGIFRVYWGYSQDVNGNLETISIALSAIAQMLAVYSLRWHSRLIRVGLISLIAIQVGIAIGEFWLPSGVIELIISATIVLNEIFLLSVLWFGRSQQQNAQQFLLIGAISVACGLVLTVLNTVNLLSLDNLNDLIVVALPMLVIISLLLADISIRRRPVNGAQSGDVRMSPALLSQISHELRTPINGIIGMYELLSDTPLSSGQRDYIETMRLASRDMLILADELSDLAKIRQQQMTLEEKPFTLANLLNKTMAHFQQEAIRKQVELVVDISDSVPHRLLGDRSRLQVLLHNLFARTLAYTEGGELTLSASYYRGGQAQGLRLQIQLAGTIVKQDELKMLFRLLQPEHQNTDDNNPRYWNLLVVRALLRQMNASLDVESMTNQGASLTLFLPVQPDPDQTADDVSDTTLNGMRVLIVDDNASLRSVLEKQLRRWGIRADSTYSGKEALAMMRNQCSLQEPYDVIIIDHDMPVMSGLQLTEKLYADDEISPRPSTLMLTGMSISSVDGEARSAGISCIIPKPASGKRLREALADLQQQKRPSQSY